jgi:hypothetical protein
LLCHRSQYRAQRRAASRLLVRLCPRARERLREGALAGGRSERPEDFVWYRTAQTPNSLRTIDPELDAAFTFMHSGVRPDGGNADRDAGEVVRVIALFEDEKVPGGGFAHVQRYTSSLYSILGEWGHPQELLRVHECATIPLAAICQAGVVGQEYGQTAPGIRRRQGGFRGPPGEAWGVRRAEIPVAALYEHFDPTRPRIRRHSAAPGGRLSAS